MSEEELNKDKEPEVVDDDDQNDEPISVDEDYSEEERAQRVAQLKPIVEGALMAAGEAMKIARIQSLFEEYELPGSKILTETLQQIQKDCEGRGFELVEVASGWRFQVREDFAIWVNRLWEEKPQKYSRALLETLALIAYRQPITRGDIEEVRGVAVSTHIMKTLSEREWIKVIGHRDVPGRPALYATTRQFLDYFNIKSLEDLPTLDELKDIESLNASLELDEKIEAKILGTEVDAEATDEAEVTDETEASEIESDDAEPFVEPDEEEVEDLHEDSESDDFIDDDVVESIEDDPESAEQDDDERF